jgi:aldehyde dehydrogenase (NAD+)
MSVDAAAVVGGLRRAFESGRTRPLEWRRQQLTRLAALLREHEEALLDALRADLGKPRAEGWASDVGIIRSDIRYALRHLRRWARPRRVHVPLTRRPARARIVPEPLGVVLVIAPWNYPIHTVLSPLVGAIAAGNCVVAKPSELSPASSALLARLLPEYLDAECVAVVEGRPEETRVLLEQRFDHVFYTGDGEVGRLVMEAAARHLTPVTLELGGKSPAIVDASAKLDVAARRITWGKFLNAGQTCIAPDYVLVAREVEDLFIEQVRRAIFDFYGPAPEQSPDYARIVNDAHHDRLVGLLDSGTVAVGGTHDRADRYVAPTVLRDVLPESPVMAEEIFGPVLPVLPFSGLDEAIAFVNARAKPLALYLFTERDDAKRRVVAETSSGGVAINATIHHVSVPELPFGGVGASGMGEYHGQASFDTFSHAKSVLWKGTRPDPDLAYPPYTDRKERLLRRFL